MTYKIDIKKYTLDILPFIFFGIYIFMSIYFYKSRITYGDTAYYLFKIIQTENFNIESYRGISVLSQWIPLILIKVNAPLKAVMIGYSLNFSLTYFMFFLITKYLLKSTFMSWGIILSATIFLHYGYYYPTEMIFSSSIIILIATYISMIDRRTDYNINPIVYYLSSFILLLSILLIHPFYYLVMGAILLSFCFIYKQKIYIYFIILCCIIFLIKMYFFKSGYEASKLSSIDLNNFNWDTINKSYLTFFWKQSFNQRLIFSKIMFFFSIIYLLYKRNWILALALPIGYIVLYLFVYLSIPNGESLGYMECYVVAISVYPIIFILSFSEKNIHNYEKIFFVLFFIISILSLNRIVHENTYTDRVSYLVSILQYGKTNNISKMIIEEEEIKHEKILVGWSLPYETILLSTLNGKTSTIYLNSSKIKIDSINNNKLFLGTPWDKPIYNLELNKKYFLLETTEYKKVNGLLF